MAASDAGRHGAPGLVDHTNLEQVIQGYHGPSMTATFLGDFARYLQDVAKVPTASSIRSYCMDVANLCASLHFPRPIFPPLLQRALDRETAAHPVSRAKHPATPAFVAAFVHDGSIPRVLRVAAALLWFSTLRGSEILATSPTTVRPFSLRRQDVSFAPDSSYLRLSFRKGKPFAKNEPSVRIIVRPDGGQPHTFDPVDMVLAYLRDTQAFDDGEPLLRHADGALATKKHLLDAIKKKARALGLNDADYGVHSLRSGGVTTMRAHNVTDADIRAQGGWLSEAGDAPYRRANVQQARRAQQALAVSRSDRLGASPAGVDMVTASTPLLPPAAALLAFSHPFAVT